MICISQGNTKLVSIPNISGLPVRDCPEICRTTCKSKCYALRIVNRRPNVAKAWRRNSDKLRLYPNAYFRELHEHLAKKKPRFFRFHVGGDVIDRDHFLRILATARKFPRTRFLMFTKNYKVIRRSMIPENLSIVLSVWQGMRKGQVPRPLHNRFPISFAGDCSNWGERFADALECPGSCETCQTCWHLARIGQDVRFDIS